MRYSLIAVCLAFIVFPCDSFALESGLTYLNSAEAELVRLTNQARTDPKGFSNQHLKNSFLPSAKEAYAEMQALSPLRPLIPVKGITFSAQDHAADMGNSGGQGHKGSDGSQPADRMGRYSKASPSGFAENCDYGYLKPIDILLHLIIDEGVESRGHRKNLLNPGLGFVGVAIRPHKGYGWNAVMDFAFAWEDKEHLPDRHAFSLDSNSLGTTLERSASDSVFRPIPDQASGPPDSSEFIVARRGFWSASLGYLGLPIPSSGLAHLGRIDFGYTWINQGFSSQFRLNLALGKSNQAFGVEYGFGIGPRSGKLHVGLLISAGYAHLWDPSADYVHGLTVGLSPVVMGTLWKSIQFSLNGGLVFVPWSSSEIKTHDRSTLGFTVGIGVHFSIDPFLSSQ